MVKKETGVMVMKDGLAWGIEYEDGYSTSFGWINPADAPIHNPKYCKRPEDVTYKNSPHFRELKTAKLVEVERTTSVEIVNITPQSSTPAPDDEGSYPE